MMTSTTADKTKIKVWAVIFWLVVWELAAHFIGQEILLVSPVAVLSKWIEFIITEDFWNSVFFSFFHIIGGFFLALLAGIVLAAASFSCHFIKELVMPLITVIKATPVASFIILVLIWVSSRNLSIVISFLMVLPVIYANVLSGIENMDQKLNEMAEVFQIPYRKRLTYIYIPQIMPFLRTACGLTLGLCWKAGTAAEVIGIPQGSIGEKLYEAKVYLETPDLFAWTLTIILLSVCFERLFLFLMDQFFCRRK